MADILQQVLQSPKRSLCRTALKTNFITFMRRKKFRFQYGKTTEPPLNDRDKWARVTNLQFQIPEVLNVLVWILNILFQGIIHKILIMYAYLTHARMSEQCWRADTAVFSLQIFKRISIKKKIKHFLHWFWVIQI